MSLLFTLLLALATAPAAEIRARIIFNQDPTDAPLGQYFNIDSGRSSGLAEGAILRVTRQVNGRSIDVAGVRVVAVNQTWSRVARLDEDNGKAILTTDAIVSIPLPETITFVPQVGHSRKVSVITVSADETLIASGAEDGTLKLWDLTSRRLLFSTQAFDPHLIHGAISYSDDGNATTLPLETITALAFSPDAHLLAVGTSGNSNNLKLWDVKTARCVGTFVDDEGFNSAISLAKFAKLSSPDVELQGAISALQFSGDGTTLVASSSERNTIKVWDVASLRRKATLQLDSIKGLYLTGDFAFSPDYKRLATLYSKYTNVSPKPGERANSTKAIRIWEVGSWKSLADPSPELDIYSRLLASNRLSQLLVLNSLTGKLDYFDWGTLKFQAHHELHTQVPTAALGGNGIVATAFDGRLKVWKPDYNLPVRVFIADDRPPIRLALTKREHPEDWEPSPTPGAGSRTVGPNRSVSLALSVSGAWLLWGGYDGTITIWNTTTDSAPIPLCRTAQTVQALAAADNTIFRESFVASSGSDGRIFVWGLRSGSINRVFSSSSRSPQAISFSADGARLSAASQFTVLAWDMTTGNLQSTWQVPVENASKRYVFASTMNATRLALGMNDGYVEVWDMVSHSRLGRVGVLSPVAVGSDTGGTRINTVVLNATGELVAFSKYAGLVEVWKTRTQELIMSTRCPGMAPHLAFSHDSRYIICATESTATAWDVQQKESARTFHTAETYISSVAISADNTKIIAGALGSLLIWDFRSGNILKVVRTGDRAVGLTLLGQSLLTALNEDATLGFYSISRPTLLAKAVARDQDDWLSFSSDGFFDGSSSAWKQGDFHSSANSLSQFELERFFTQFYQPALLSTVLSERRPIRDVLAGLNDDRSKMRIERLKESHLPNVQIELHGADNQPVETRSLSLMIRAEDMGSGVEGCRLFRNGVLVYHSAENQTSNGPVLQIPFDLSVIAGKNQLRAYCFNRDGLKSKDATAVVSGAPSLFRRGKAYVLAIGVNEYIDSPLHFAVADAEAVAHTLSLLLAGVAEFEPAPPIVLRDGEATKESILWTLRRLAGGADVPRAPLPQLESISTAGPEDALVIFFAGHGMARDGHYYLMPYNHGESISDADLSAYLAPVDVGHLALIVDSCESGSLLLTEQRTGPLNSSGLPQLAYEKGGYILAASQHNQLAREYTGLGHGLLSYVLLNDASSVLKSTPPPRKASLGDWFTAAIATAPIVQRRLSALSKTRDVEVKAIPAAKTSAVDSYQLPELYLRRDGDQIAFPIGPVVH